MSFSFRDTVWSLRTTELYSNRENKQETIVVFGFSKDKMCPLVEFCFISCQNVEEIKIHP